MEPITLNVNGQLHSVNVDPETPLLYILQDDLGLRGPRFGCGMAQCGACTVILNDQVIRSWVKPVGEVGAAAIITLDGWVRPRSHTPFSRPLSTRGPRNAAFVSAG